MQQSLFDQKGLSQPLADRLRPQTLEDYVGQEHLLGPGKVLRQMIEQDEVPSMIFWGPPGVGKTTLARIIARHTKAEFVNFSAVTSGIKELRQVMAQAETTRLLGQKTILNEFVAYFQLQEWKDAGLFLYQKSILMSTYILCGFANISSIGILLGGMGVLAPEKRELITRFGFPAMIAGALVSVLSATIIGMMLIVN